MSGTTLRLIRNAPRVSVVVPTYRRPALLQRCLEALLAQTLPPEDVEILVVDDGHEDEVRERVTAIAARHLRWSIRYLRPERRGPAAARNCGWRAARAPVVAFTDDDTIPAPAWLAEGEAALQRQPQLSAVAGRVVVPPLDPGQPPTDHERMTRGLETAEFVTANAFVRRAALEAVDGFDERFKRAWREDSDLQFRLQREAGAVGRCADACVVHPVREAPWGISLGQQCNVYFDALLYKKHPNEYRTRIRRTPPWDYYVVVAAALAALVTWIAAAPPMLVAALAALPIVLVLRLALHRLRAARRTPEHVVEMLATSVLIPFLSVYWRVRGAVDFRVLFV